jgi:hypothetical protein
MTMRRISVLLVAVMMMLAMAMSTASAATVCIDRKGDRNDTEIRNISKDRADRILDNRPRAERGECDNDGDGKRNLGQRIAKFTVAPF